MKHNYPQIGEDLGKLIAEKQKAYGDSYGKSGELLKVLFPNGINPDNYTNLLAIVRIIDKLFRISTDPNWGGESPWKDICGYALLRLADEENKAPASPVKTRLDEVENTHDVAHATVSKGRDPGIKDYLVKINQDRAQYWAAQDPDLRDAKLG